MNLRPDDDIHRFEPVWRDLKGWEIPFVARYVVWAAWFIIFLPLLIGLLLLDIVNVPITFLLAAAISAIITNVWVADKINPENSLDAVITSITGELSAWGLHNQLKAKAKTEHAVQMTSDSFTALSAEAKPFCLIERNRKETAK